MSEAVNETFFLHNSHQTIETMNQARARPLQTNWTSEIN